MRMIKIFLALIFTAGVLVPATALAAADVDLLLVLAADVSRSIDTTKFQLQRDGYAAAISDPRVLDTIRSGHNGRIGLTFVEWSGVGAQHVVIDWTAVGDAASAKDFGDRLLETPRSFAGRTSISGAHRICHGASRRTRRSTAFGAPSTFPATAPTMPAATSPNCATKPLPRASPSTAWSSSATTRCRGIRITPIRPAASTITIATTSSAARALSSWWRKTSTRSARPSSAK